MKKLNLIKTCNKIDAQSKALREEIHSLCNKNGLDRIQCLIRIQTIAQKIRQITYNIDGLPDQPIVSERIRLEAAFNKSRQTETALV